jgi:amino acid transporter
MLILGLVILGKGGSGGVTLSMLNPGETSLLGITGGGVLGGVLIGILLFVGFEAAASIGEESRDPHRSIPRAVLWTIGVAAAFYVFMAFAFSIGYGKGAVSQGAWAFSTGPVDELATKYVGSWYATILDLVVILDATALALAICVTIGRGFFALGRDGLLPGVFAKVSRHETPWVGNLMVAVGGVAMMLLVPIGGYGATFTVPDPAGKLVPLFPNDQFATFVLTATIGSFAIELVYLALAVAAFRLVPRSGNRLWQYAVVLVAAATPILGYYGALNPAPHDGSNYNWQALYWFVALLAVTAVWFAIVRLMRPEHVALAASHASQHEGVPPLDETIGFQPVPSDGVVP